MPRTECTLAPPTPRAALLIDLDWLDTYAGTRVGIRDLFVEAVAVHTAWPQPPLLHHRLVAASATLIRGYLTELLDLPVALAHDGITAGRVLLDRARTLARSRFSRVTVLAHPETVYRIGHLGLSASLSPANPADRQPAPQPPAIAADPICYPEAV